MNQNKKQDLAMQKLREGSHVHGDTAGYLESLYESYLQDPSSVTAEWCAYFDRLNPQSLPEVSHAAVRTAFALAAQEKSLCQPVAMQGKQAQVNQLIDAYRRMGHFHASLDPLGLKPPRLIPQLGLEYHQLSASDASESFDSDGLFDAPASLAQIEQKLKATYAGNVGIEYMHISNPEERQWLQTRLEHQAHEPVDAATQKRILEKLIAAEGLEHFLAQRYVGQKRFSLEGGDALIPVLHEIIQSAGKQSVKEVLIGMAHRGRLNVLLNILGMPVRDLCDEFEGKIPETTYSGDVKYHKGFSSDVPTEGGDVHLALGFNPSHLEFINPVLMGSARARQHRYRAEIQPSQVLPILIHGDAAITGQGVVMETLNMSQTRAYHIQGVLHIVINNQVGFTTSHEQDARSGHYCTDVTKMIEMPVFHVNGDDPEAVVFYARLALDYRMRFKKDAIVDLVCYRRLGHNEADEPAATQPLMYQHIRQKPTLCTAYATRMQQENRLSAQAYEAMRAAYQADCAAGKSLVATVDHGVLEKHKAHWAPYLDQQWDVAYDAGLDSSQLKSLGESMLELPEGFVLQRQVARMMAARKDMIQGNQPLDWGTAEVLAYATLLQQGFSVRLVGQDVRRGTFSHRHLTVHDQKTGKDHTLLNPSAGFDMQIYDSVLSESGALGFEYGYSTTDPNALVIWEAQFGDFANGAQVIIDQFISSGWQKWQRLSGLVLLLPHGFEGMGPEHSSARLERYLQLCAQKNMQVCVPTTPAQIFHLLRRQMLRPYRRPLVVMSPKVLLRHKTAVSHWDDLIQGQFQLVIPESCDLDPQSVTRILLCSGKVYYELFEKRQALQQHDTVILRIEQLYPFPYDAMLAQLQQYPHAREILWCQEEPRNQGAWYSIRHCLESCMQANQGLEYVGRDASAAPASGYAGLHKKQQEALLEDAFQSIEKLRIKKNDRY